MGMKRLISYKYAQKNAITCFIIDPEIEDEIAGSIHTTGQDVYLTLGAEYDWIDSFGKRGLNLSGPVYTAGLLFEV